jgi:hypothetical protein
MKTFHCDACSGPLFFENSLCTRCNVTVGYFPDRDEMGDIKEGRHRPCRNFAVEQVCNWTIPADDPSEYCLSCRLTRVIPDLERPGYRALWQRAEMAKRRLIHGLLDLGLPVVGKDVDEEQGLAFEFLADDPEAEQTVLTGHADGVITLNIAEADDAERERRRLQLHEPYRTLLGHLRHEVGHYYWNLLIRDSERLPGFRRVFGDERADYAESLKRHYDEGAPADWQGNFVSSYASSHPWEDWAETWAHYLHMADSLDTASASGIALQRTDRRDTAVGRVTPLRTSDDFGGMISNWMALTCVLNNLNRSMGMQDAYPFALPEPALAKLRFIHELVSGAEPRIRNRPSAAATPPPQRPPQARATAH